MKCVTTKFIFLFLFAVLLTDGSVVDAQQQNKVPRLGFLSLTNTSTLSTRLAAFRQGLRDLGYREGKNINIEYRWAEGKDERLADLATELVGLHVDAIVTAGPQPTRAAKAKTTTIPIIMAQDNDPVGNGFITSFSQPGGNITGLCNFGNDIHAKRLEILKGLVPRLSRVALLGTLLQPGVGQQIRDVEIAARALNLRLQYQDVVVPADIEKAFQAARKWQANAILVIDSAIIDAHRALTVDLAAKSGLPAMYPQRVFMAAGGLVFYGSNGEDLFKRAATYVDKILKGKSPAELPVARPRKGELIINLKAAKQIGLTMPPEMLVRADQVIE